MHEPSDRCTTTALLRAAQHLPTRVAPSDAPVPHRPRPAVQIYWTAPPRQNGRLSVWVDGSALHPFLSIDVGDLRRSARWPTRDVWPDGRRLRRRRTLLLSGDWVRGRVGQRHRLQIRRPPDQRNRDRGGIVNPPAPSGNFRPIYFSPRVSRSFAVRSRSRRGRRERITEDGALSPAPNPHPG